MFSALLCLPVFPVIDGISRLQDPGICLSQDLSLTTFGLIFIQKSQQAMTGLSKDLEEALASFRDGDRISIF
ncbi:hypothetical protein BDN70DRAFT_883549 [Pholiota conissans]|uniref:Uncharacterized protein n=1 Tax=Pholiota conissans TaxID=109636 RepID=A0A9P6CXH8_9AGAR|nr:hypothetical protein BDN70DRAFT_883549 [Pholiota conissans]